MAGRKRSEVRQRKNLLAVRFTDAELALVHAEMARTKKGAATLLRERFMASLAPAAPEPGTAAVPAAEGD